MITNRYLNERADHTLTAHPLTLNNSPDKNSNTINARLTAVLELFGLVQTVSGPTRGNNFLKILAHNFLVLQTMDGLMMQTVCTIIECFVNNVRVDDADCMSDHRMTLAQLASGWRHLKPVLFSFHRLKQLNFDFFENCLNSSSLFASPATSANGFAHLFAENGNSYIN